MVLYVLVAAGDGIAEGDAEHEGAACRGLWASPETRRDGDRTAQIGLVSAWASANTLALDHVKTQEKSNEIPAISQFTANAGTGGAHRHHRRQGMPKEFAFQGQMHEVVRNLFEGAEEFDFDGVPHDYATTLHKDHWRVEWGYWVISTLWWARLGKNLEPRPPRWSPRRRTWI